MRDKEKAQVIGRNEESDRKPEDLDPHVGSILALGSWPLEQDNKDVDGRNVPPPLPPRRYENLDPHEESVFVLSCRSQSAAPKKPPPGHHAKMKERNTEKSPGPEQACQQYEDMNVESGGVEVILGSGLKRAVPDIPPPRKLDMGDKVSKRKKEDKENEVMEVVGHSVPSARQLNTGDPMVVWPERNEELSAIYSTSDEAHRMESNESPPHKFAETEEVHSEVQSKKENDEEFDDRTVPTSSSWPKKQYVDGRNEGLNRKYEDCVDPHGYSIFALSSSPKKQGGEDVEDRNVPPPLPPRKYEDMDPHGESILVLSSGLQRAVPNKPLPRHLAKMEVRDSKLSPRKKCDEDVPPPLPPKKFHDLDKGEKNKEQVDGGNAESDRRYENVDQHGESIFGSGPGLHRASLKELPAVRPGHGQESCSESPCSSEDPNRDEERDGPGLCHRVRDRAKEMWDKGKSSSLCWLILGCAVLVMTSVVMATILVPPIMAVGKQADDSVSKKQYVTPLEKPETPWLKTLNKEIGSDVSYSTSSSSPLNLTNADINECNRKPCQHGRCVNKDGGYRCTCSPGWTGQNCQQDINECTRKPCQHGRCVNKDGGYKCTCSPGWTGQNCQQDINECTRKPCQHGRCVNKDGGYKCTCSPGWTGKNCQQAQPRQSGWRDYNNHYYKLMEDKVSWATANWRCEQHGGNLSSIKDSDENDFIADVIRNAKGYLRHHVWFGLKRGPDGQFKWTDGSPLSYSNWAPGEPDNHSFLSFGKGEGCGAVISKGDKPHILRAELLSVYKRAKL
ncbi:VCAN [Branchiostoma lanceolatum]|uniref:VCAN protein n=1 Tax=Branchiostoma lanceolatum TaxID=7740 RepID=A0A8J9YU18_BRALA|nr:VCAN [Branchiostoma lanceolatum]